MSWDEAAAIIADGTLPSLAKLGRVPSGTRKYRKFKAEHILATYASVTDYLYASVFNIECTTKGRYWCYMMDSIDSKKKKKVATRAAREKYF
jgi:hypothetical protein